MNRHCELLLTIKATLLPRENPLPLNLTPDTGFAWKGYCETTVDELLCGNGSLLSKTSQAEKLLKDLLSEGEMLSEEITSQAKELDISNRTLKIAKQNIGVKSFRKGDKWYSSLPRG